jgi:hypothetical protein
MTYANNIGEAQKLPSIRSVTPIDEPIGDDRETQYKIMRIVVTQNATVFNTDEASRIRRITDPIKVSGDHITILAVDGQDFIGLSLNRQQYIPVRQGQTIRRRFTEFRLRTFGYLNGGPVPIAVPQGLFMMPTEVTLAVSYGPLVQTDFRATGFKMGCPKFRGTATVGGVTIFGGMNSGPSNNSVPHQILKWGGTMLLRNLDGAASLFLSDAPPTFFSPDTAWEIFPGEVLSLDAESRLSQANRRIFNELLGPYLYCLAGTVPYNVMLSSWGDSSDLESLSGIPACGLEYSDNV